MRTLRGRWNEAGTSGNYFGVDPLFFQVQVPVESELVVVVNSTTGGDFGPAGGNPFHLTDRCGGLGYLEGETYDANH